MSQRNSEYERIKRDVYETPEWVTTALIPHIPERIMQIWEPACATGRMVRELERFNFDVFGSDIESLSQYEQSDFLISYLPHGTEAIITNPPYELATEFIEKSLANLKSSQGFIAMLLRTDFDHAKSRVHLFRDHPAFAKKLVLMKRIIWFVEDDGKPKASPSFNHAWYIWDWINDKEPVINYGP